MDTVSSGLKRSRRFSEPISSLESASIQDSVRYTAKTIQSLNQSFKGLIDSFENKYLGSCPNLHPLAVKLGEQLGRTQATLRCRFENIETKLKSTTFGLQEAEKLVPTLNLRDISEDILECITETNSAVVTILREKKKVEYNQLFKTYTDNYSREHFVKTLEPLLIHEFAPYHQFYLNQEELELLYRKWIDLVKYKDWEHHTEFRAKEAEHQRKKDEKHQKLEEKRIAQMEEGGQNTKLLTLEKQVKNLSDKVESLKLNPKLRPTKKSSQGKKKPQGKASGRGKTSTKGAKKSGKPTGKSTKPTPSRA